MLTKLLTTCLFLASQTYSVPPEVMIGILEVEGGRVGQEVGNTNGTYDMGPMQINTIWLPELAQRWGVSRQTAHRWVRDDGCTNMGVAAWILRSHIDETQDLSKAIAHYHSRTPTIGYAYKRRVVAAMERNGFLENVPQ